MKKRMIACIVGILVGVNTLAGCGLTSENASTVGMPTNDNTLTGCELANGKSDTIVVDDSMTVAANDAMDTTCEIADATCEMAIEEDYNCIYPEPFEKVPNNGGMKKVKDNPWSTFAADVDTASYSNVRRYIWDGYGASYIPRDIIRPEEMINYFDYNYASPKKGETFGVDVVMSDCPWNEGNLLVRMGITTQELDKEEIPASNYVFLIDVSGSMQGEDRLELLKRAANDMVDTLDEDDRISIVTYASSDRIVAEGLAGDDHRRIKRIISNLDAGGSTNGGAGIISAYEIAEKYFIDNGNNRVILATDGDLNVGLTSEEELEKLITEEREKGVFLTVLGFGTGNYKDNNLELLADKGNGNYFYIDSLKEGRRVLIEKMSSNMFVAAKDVKMQVEFNPEYVAEYRQIGYEDRRLADRDFEDDSKDGGEIGFGHSITVMYEIVPANGSRFYKQPKYGDSEVVECTSASDEWMTLSVRYKEPDGDKSKLYEFPVNGDAYTDRPSEDYLFAQLVVRFAGLLKDNQYSDIITYDEIGRQLKAMSPFMDEDRAEFYELVCTTADNNYYEVY